jgi:adenine-specific DNA-methyltransferase
MDNILIQNIESINYMGSKIKLLPFFIKHFPINKNITFFDGFAGSHRVGAALQSNFKSVTAVDKQIYSKVIGDALLTSEDDFDLKIINILNSLPVEDGFITQTYGGVVGANNSSIQLDNNTRLFTIETAGKIQSIRNYIERENLSNIYLYALIISAAKYQNSTGHQNGYLKTFSTNSLRPFVLTAPKLPSSHNKKLNAVYSCDIFEKISEYHDVFYFDPPYGTINTNVPVSTRYSAFYHFWTTLVNNDTPQIFGKANRRIDTKGDTDVFEVNKSKTFLPLIKKLFDESNGKDIFISLSNHAIVDKTDVLDYCSDMDIIVHEMKHSENVQGKRTKKTGKFSVEKPPLVEYLYHLKK